MELVWVQRANGACEKPCEKRIGKSWLLHQLGRRLAADGWVVATHYCFVDLLDAIREHRVSVDATFGNLIAELLDVDPSLQTDRVPRFAAGPRELETILANGHAEHPDRRIAIIVDGLDHADRILPGRMPGAAADIVEELAALDLPDNVSVSRGERPGLAGHTGDGDPGPLCTG